MTTTGTTTARRQPALDVAGYTAPDGSTANTDPSSADANLFGH